ncbi:MAG: GtrA family protein [Clostridia bacterium]|nr:GtrA family protein [Clostridia bacterium]
MLKKIKNIYSKYKDIILYLFYGVLTTLVNFAVFYVLFNITKLHYAAANVLAWIAAVAFAYITNRRFVFDSKKTGGAIVGEAAMFVAARLLSLGCETLILLAGDALDFDVNTVKIAALIVVVVLNYIFSKLFVFKKN